VPSTRVKRADTVETPEPVASNGRHPVLLTREAILSAQDVATDYVDVPEWGGTVKVRGLTGRARDSLEARFANEQGVVSSNKAGDFRAAFVALSIVDDTDRLLFSEADIEGLGEKSSTALQRVFETAIRLSAVRPGDVDGMVETLKSDPTAVTG